MDLQKLAQRRSEFVGTDAEFITDDNAVTYVLSPQQMITLTSIRGAIGAQYSAVVFNSLKQSDPFGYDCLIAGIRSDAPETLSRLTAIQQMLPPAEAAALKALCYTTRRASGENRDTTQADLDLARYNAHAQELRDAVYQQQQSLIAAIDALTANNSALPSDITGL